MLVDEALGFALDLLVDCAEGLTVALEVALTVALTVGLAVALTVGLLLILIVGCGVGFFVAALALPALIANAIESRRATFFSRAPI